MAKKDAAAKVDAIACAERCETQAQDCAASHPAMSQQFIEAATLLRTMHRALMSVDCQHVLTFTVTKAMIDSGRETREKGKYCMTCGARLEKPQEQKQDEPGESAE